MTLITRGRTGRATVARVAVTGLLGAALAVGTAVGTSPVALAATCEIPAARSEPAVAATAVSGTEQAGTGVIEIEGQSATPATSPAATPIAPATDPAATLESELMAVSEALAACLSEGDVETVVQLAGERYLGQLFGSSVPMAQEEYRALAGELTPLPTRIVGLDQVTPAEDGRATAIVIHVVGNQLMQAEWTFEQAPRGERESGRSGWRVAVERQLPALTPSGAATIAVEIGERSFRLDRETVNGPDVVLRGENAASADHEMLVLRLAPGYTTADLLRAAGPDPPAEATWIGEIPVRAGSERDLVLVDLEPGVYTLVCLFPDAEGTPHLAQGMEAEFTVD